MSRELHLLYVMKRVLILHPKVHKSIPNALLALIRVILGTTDANIILNCGVLLYVLDNLFVDTSFEDLCILETERLGQAINNITRLVGGQDLSSSRNRSSAEISNSGIMRCTDCPRTFISHSCLLVCLVTFACNDFANYVDGCFQS